MAHVFKALGIVAGCMLALVLLTAQSLPDVGGGGAAFTGGTLTSLLTFSGVAPDIATASAEDLTLAPGSGGTAAKIIAGGTGIRVNTSAASAAFDVSGSDAAPTGTVATCGSGHACARIVGASSRGADLELRAGNGNASGGSSLLFTWADATDDREVWRWRMNAATLTLSNVDEDDGIVSSTPISVYDTGAVAIGHEKTCDCGTAGTPNTVTCDLSSNVIYLTDGDADACTVTISETSAALFQRDFVVNIVVISTGGGGNFTMAESAGVVDLEGGTSFAGSAIGDNITLRYVSSGSIDQFYETARREGL